MRYNLAVTVCVAAIFQDAGVVGASDRMLTSGDVQFEPQQRKIWQITSSIAIMIAGDAAFQAEILRDVRSVVKRRNERGSGQELSVHDVASLYSKYASRARMKKAQGSILTPLGLTFATFNARQNHMAPSFVQQLATELINFKGPEAQAIICGIDPDGSHIYVANEADISCQDIVGFAAIGAGYWHADSHMMFAGHDRWKVFSDAIHSVFSAKRRAEVAPGVGNATDMFVIGPDIGSFILVGDHVLQKLADVYKDSQAKQEDMNVIARRCIGEYVTEITNAQATEKQEFSTEDGNGNASTDQENAGG